MGNARLPTSGTKQQLDRAEHDHEGPCLHRDRWKQQHHPLVREQHAVGEQQAEYTTRRAQHRCPALGEPGHQQLAHAGAGHAHEVIRQESLLAPGLFQRRAEHEERQHVEEQMVEPAMQERIGQQLPRHEAGARRERIEAIGERPQHQRRQRRIGRQQAGTQVTQRPLQDEHAEIGDQQGFGDGRQLGQHGGILRDCRSS